MKQKKIGTTLYVFSEDPYVITEDTDANIIYIQEEVIFDFAKINIPLISKMKPINYHLVCVKHPEWSDYYNDFTVYVEQTTGGTITVYPTSGDEGEEIQVSHLASERYDFDHWNIVDEDGNEIEVKNGKFLMPASNVTVSAVFIQTVFSITINDTEHGTVTSNKQTATVGDTVTLIVNPDVDYKLNILTVVDENDNPITVTNNQFIMPASDVIVNATFSQIEYTISIVQTAHGSVSSNVQTAVYGETITLRITPDTDYKLNTLTVLDANNNPIAVTNNHFIMPRSNVTVSATFNMITYTISVGQTTNGSVTSNKQTALVGETVTLTVTPDSGYELDTLTVVDSNSNPITVTNNQFIMPASNVTVSATFSMITYNNQYLTIESQADNNTILWKSTDWSNPQNIQYSTDLTNWTTVTGTNTGATLATLNTGEKIYLKGTILGYEAAWTNNSIDSSGNFIVYGNIMSLTNGDNFVNATTLTKNYQLARLFSQSKVTDASNLVLPATTLTEGCYYGMFGSCYSLTTAPVLPATTLVNSCYGWMFEICSSLNFIVMLATDISATDCLNSWVRDVAATGTFVKAASMTTLPTGVNGIPSGWTVQDA